VSTVWVVSSVLAWVVIALLVAVVLSLLRQTAELRLRLDEFDGGELFEAPDDDARLHEAVPATLVRGVVAADGSGAIAGIGATNGGGTPQLTLGGLQDRPALLVFHSPGCHGCVGIEEAVEALAAEDPEARVVSVLALRRDDAADHLRRRPLRGVPTVSIDDLPRELRRPSTPSMLGLSRDGTIALLRRRPPPPDARRGRRLVRALPPRSRAGRRRPQRFLRRGGGPVRDSGLRVSRCRPVSSIQPRVPFGSASERTISTKLHSTQQRP
jgi:hypothetical protein